VRLSDFITTHLEPILQEWENFARTVHTPMPPLDVPGLRNHAAQILKTVAQDLRTHQTVRQEIEKSQGRGPHTEHDTAAQTHAVKRLVDGFTLDQMVSEYRALRSSVLRLWLSQGYSADEHQVADIIRFNEAVDQALTESIATYEREVETTRKRVLGVLGHDLRSPLSAVMMASEVLSKKSEPNSRQAALAIQIGSSTKRATAIVNDLLDLARSNLTSGMALNLEKVELTQLCMSVVSEIQTAEPRARILCAKVEPITGHFDSGRMEQVFSNLIGNAVHHGDLQRPVQIELVSNGLNMTFTVQNWGELIPETAIPHLFNPESRYSSHAAEEKGPSAGLGLGLFVAAQIVEGHGGRIEVTSTEQHGTIFRAHLPIT
jgi:signal transduction histidine kinase